MWRGWLKFAIVPLDPLQPKKHQTPEAIAAPKIENWAFFSQARRALQDASFGVAVPLMAMKAVRKGFTLAET